MAEALKNIDKRLTLLCQELRQAELSGRLADAQNLAQLIDRLLGERFVLMTAHLGRAPVPSN